MNSILAEPRIDTPPQANSADIHNALTQPIQPEEDSLQQSIREQVARQRGNESHHTMPESPPTPGYFRPEFPYEKRWKVHRAGMGLKRPKIRSIGRLNPELLQRNQHIQNDLTSQVDTPAAVLRMETIIYSPSRLISHQQLIASVSEQASPSNLDSTISQGLYTPANEPVAIGNRSSSSLLPNDESEDDLNSKGTDVQRKQKFDQPSAAESPDNKIQLSTSHLPIKMAQPWITATVGDFADKYRHDRYQLLSEVPCSSKQADERDQLYLRQIAKDKSEKDAEPAVPDRTTSEYQYEISNTTERMTQWATGSTQSGSLEDVASPETVKSHDIILTTSLLSEASRRLQNLVKPPSSWQRDQTVLLPQSGPQSRSPHSANSVKRKLRDEDNREESNNKRPRISPSLPISRSQQNVCDDTTTRRRRTKRKCNDQTDTDDSDEEIKRRRT